VDEVTVDAVAWVTRFVGGDGTSHVAIRELLRPDDTLRTVLHRLSRRYPKLEQALWDGSTGELAEHIQIMLNNLLLSGRTTLDTQLKAGDAIMLVGQFMGGDP
jgi:molybdopterin converting factor small subunit